MKIFIGNTKHQGWRGIAAQSVVLTLAVMIATYIMPGVEIINMWAALLTGIVIALLNRFVRPVLVFLTLPFTALTFGLFLLFINAVIVLLADAIVSGFYVDGFVTALLFGLLLTLLNFLLDLPNRIKTQSDNSDYSDYSNYSDKSDNQNTL